MTKINRRKWMLGALLVLGQLSLGTLFTSCSDKDDLDDPTVRLQQFTSQCVDVLKAAPNGWAMYMYGDEDFGGFNVLLKFEDGGKVTVANELITAKSGADTTAVTHYKFEQSSGLVLSFDEYCELFHYFSDPRNPDGFNSTTENGFGADLEFRMLSATADSVVMKGKKHGSRITMVPVDQNISWGDYLKGVKNVASVMQKGSYQMILGKDSLKLRTNRKNRVLSYKSTDEEGNPVTKSVSYIITPEGLTFHQPFSYQQRAVRGFQYVAGEETFKQQGGGDVVLHKYTPNLNELFVDGIWYLELSGLSGYAKVRWNTFNNGLKIFGKDNEQDLSLYYACVGTMFSHFGVTVGPVDRTAPTSVYVGECYYDYQFIGTDQITMWFNGETDSFGNADYYLDEEEGASLGSVVQLYGSDRKNARTFRLESDNVSDPTYIKLTDTKNSSNYMTLKADPVYYPYGDGPTEKE